MILILQDGTLREYCVSLAGKDRKTGRGWYARIDLDPEQRGAGPCSHPALHCHVEEDPEADGVQESRVPLPWLLPDEALEWLLATAHPEKLEPVTSSQTTGR